MDQPRQIHTPRSLTAPDACVAVLVALYLQYNQHKRRKQQQTRSSSASAPRRGSSPFHELLFTNLSVMICPSNMAANLNAKLVDLKSEQESNNSSGGMTSDDNRKSKTTKSENRKSTSRAKEVKSRRIKNGELVLSRYFGALETVLNLSFAALVGTACRWLFGLIRSLRLSRVTGNMSGPCCSPYSGFDNDQSESFERLLACVLIKNDGDESGKFLLSTLLAFLFVSIFVLARSVSKHFVPEEETDENKDTKTEQDTIYKRVSTQKVTQVLVYLGATLSALWLFHTPTLLRHFGLAGLILAAEEMSARLVLLANLIGILAIPETDPQVALYPTLQILSNGCLLVLAIAWGMLASKLMSPIQEIIRNATFLLTSNSPRHRNKKQSPDEMVALINIRIMLIIQALVPFFILLTYFAETKFAENLRINTAKSLSKKLFQNSGQYVRVGLSWSFIGASLYTVRALLQSYLDQAVSAAPGGVAFLENEENRPSSKSGSIQLPNNDPFSERYNTIVFNAAKIVCFPAFIFVTLAFAHLRGGEGLTHPGVGLDDLYVAERQSLKGLLPPYNGQYVAWLIESKITEPKEAGDSLLRAAVRSQQSWEATPFRDIVQRRIADATGRKSICYPPHKRSVKYMGRQINHLLLLKENITANENQYVLYPMNGRELLEFAQPIPFSLLGLFYKQIFDPSNNGDDSCSVKISHSSEENQECTVPTNNNPSMTIVISSVFSHTIFSPTIVVPFVEVIALLSSIWWSILYSVSFILFLARNCKSSRPNYMGLI